MAAQVITSIVRIVSISILARMLVPEDFGLIAMVTALSVFAERFKDVGLGDATVQSREIDHEQVSNLFWINFAICAGIGLLLAGGAKIIAWFYGEPRLTAITVVIASTFFFSGLVIQHQALLRRRLHFGSLAIIQVGSTLLSLVVAVLFAYWGFGYWALVAREFSRAVFMFLGTWILCPWIPGFFKKNIELSRLIAFGKNVTGFNLIYFFTKSFDKILLGKLQGPYWVGVYTNAYQFISLPIGQIQQPVNTVALPALSALQIEPIAFDAYFDKMVRFLLFLCMPGVVFLTVFADKFIFILLGPNWDSAIPIFQILAIGAFIEPAVVTVGPAMLAAGKSGQYFRIGLLESGLRLGCLITGSFWGALGIACRLCRLHLFFVGNTVQVRPSLYAREYITRHQISPAKWIYKHCTGSRAVRDTIYCGICCSRPMAVYLFSGGRPDIHRFMDVVQTRADHVGGIPGFGQGDRPAIIDIPSFGLQDYFPEETNDQSLRFFE